MIDIDALSQSVPKSGDEYIAEDGLLHCKKCGDPLECIINPLKMGERKVRCICSCIKQKRDAEEAEQRNIVIERNRRRCFGETDFMLKECTFGGSTDNDNLKIAKNYVKHFENFRKNGNGLILWGNVGTGKSHMAACIANSLIDKGYTVIMTNFATVVNRLQESFEGRQDYINRLTRCTLLIIDDLGAERKTDYMQEQVFNVIDARYRSGKPMIITTNLTPRQLKDPENIEQGRIYDRILERCHPVEVTGYSMRRTILKNAFWETDRMLKGVQTEKENKDEEYCELVEEGEDGCN